MTFNSPRRWLALAMLAAPLAWAGLGEAESSIEGERAHMHAQRSVARSAQYAVHELKMADGSRVRQYVAGNGLVFAVSWTTLYKPDLATLLGSSFPSYSNAAHQAVVQGGMQRQFRHEAADLVVQASGRMNVYRGFAYRPSLTPKGVNLQSVGLG
jgi:predicted heme/steroid binding protein